MLILSANGVTQSSNAAAGGDSMNYREQLRDPRWQRFRLKILERDNWRCTVCGIDVVELHVHHIDYGRNPWDIPPSSAATVCHTCHAIEHERVTIEDLVLAVLVQYPDFHRLITPNIYGVIRDVAGWFADNPGRTTAQLLETMRDREYQPRLQSAATDPRAGEITTESFRRLARIVEKSAKAAVADKWPEERSVSEQFHRMVAQSIREQNAAIAVRNGTQVEPDKPLPVK